MPASSPPSSHWPTEPASGRGRSHGTSGSAPFDRWFRYPAGFASDYVTMLLRTLGLGEGTVVDCFAGSGVTGTACRGSGLGFVGIETHPLVAELAALKLQRTVTSAQLRSLLTEVVAAAKATKENVEAVEAETDLVRRSFSTSSLTELIAIRELVRERLDDPAGLYLKWALLATLRDVASVKVGWPYQRPGVARTPRYPDVLARFGVRVEQMALDLEATLLVDDVPDARIILGDSRDAATWESIAEPAAACVGSPPYLNNFDYADATRLELYFWGEVTTWARMCQVVRSGMVTATTQQASVVEKRSAIDALESLSDGAANQVLKLVDEISEAMKVRGRRAKEYDRVVPAYFLAMRQILENLHRRLEPGASTLWLVGDSAPYGVYVDTPQLIGDLASGVGFEFREDVQLRVRGNRWGSNTDRHKVGLSERIIVLRRA